MQIAFKVQGLKEIVQRCQAFNEHAPELIQEKILESVQENVVPISKALAPKKTGKLVASIEAVAGEIPSVLLQADKFYAPFLEYGTTAHLIESSSAKALHWTKGGQDFFAKRVLNPGIPFGKFTFLEPALQEGIEAVFKDIEQLMIQILQE